MEYKQNEILRTITKLMIAVILAAGMIIAAGIFSNTIAGRPVVGSFSGSLSQNESNTNILMDLDELRFHLSIYPSESSFVYDNEGNVVSDYDYQEQKLRDDLKQNITSGKWTNFPYVQLGERLFFSKQAVDEWFYEQGKAQFSVE